MRPDDADRQRARQGRVIDYLRDPGAHPDGGPVTVIETHLAWLFLSARRATKLRKVLRYSYLDYGSVEARRRQGEAEVRLNRRLADGVYLGVEPISEGPRGRLAWGTDGTPLEYVVRMRRLSEGGNLERLLRDGELSAARVDALGDRLAHFYAGLPGATVDADAHVAALIDDMAADVAALRHRTYGLDQARVARIGDAARALARAHRGDLTQRVRDGRVVEGHGDLRPEHVYFLPEPAVIDCLEFNAAMRTLDAVEELGFLAMECERLGAPWIGPRVFRHYTRATGDEPAESLRALFMARRALMWAKLALWHLDRAPGRDRDKWVSRAEDYLALAEGYVT